MNRIRTLLLVSSQSLTIAVCLAAFVASAAADSEEIIYRFKGGSDGYSPTGSLLADSAGNLYGATAEGGSDRLCGINYPTGCGTIFELTPPAEPGGAWVETVLYRFQGGADGSFPNGSLVADANGNLYGTASGGGVGDNGSVFELLRPSSPGGTWTLQVLYDFQGVPSGAGDGDGSSPNGSLAFDASGNLYGTTLSGGYCTNFQDTGPTCYGTVFELQPPAQPGAAWTESVLHRFGARGLWDPQSGVILDAKGNLYGTTYLGSGAYKLIRPRSSGESWILQVLYDDLGGPDSTLVFDAVGNLYGTAISGGSANEGIVFELSPPSSRGMWTEAALYNFNSTGDGNSPTANVIFDNAGNLYGTTPMGGDFYEGTVFRLTPRASEWQETILHNFGRGSDGQQPSGGLTFGLDGALYGVTAEGGSKKTSTNCLLDDFASTCGAVFRVAP
jgi:uncharacterized repeat protein (TIGR03803 family)